MSEEKAFVFGNLEIDPVSGNPVMGSSELEQVAALMAEVGQDPSRELHQLVGQGMRAPIRQMAAYREWAALFFEPWQLAFTDDNKIPLDDYIAVAWQTHPDGQVLLVRPGLKFTRPDFTMIDTAMELPWDVLRAAGWPILQRKMQECAEELARLRDSMGQTVLNTAVASVTGHTSTVATAITKVAIDAIFKSAAQIGFPIRRVAINSGTVLAMRGWTGSSFGMEHLTDEMIRALVTRGYLGEYGGADWYAHHSVPADYVYFGGAPAEIGYHQMKGGTRAVSDIDIINKTDIHTLDEYHAYYVGNAYNLWRLQIT